MIAFTERLALCYAAIVIKSSLFDEFVREVLSRCPSAEFSFSTPEEENEEKKKK